MGKFRIMPHMRLQEWVAEEKGYFADETAIPLCGRRKGRNFGVSGVYSCAASRQAKTVQPLVCGTAR
jgi:hypothetical protein